MPISATRALLRAALDEGLRSVEYRTDPVFGFEVPVSVPGVDDGAARPALDLARPRRVRPQGARSSPRMFRENFEQFAESAGDGRHCGRAARLKRRSTEASALPRRLSFEEWPHKPSRHAGCVRNVATRPLVGRAAPDGRRAGAVRPLRARRRRCSGSDYLYTGGGAHYLSPFYSPDLESLFGFDVPFSPALLVVWAPLGLRATCYYYRKAYYRSFFLAPPACAVRRAEAKRVHAARPAAARSSRTPTATSSTSRWSCSASSGTTRSAPSSSATPTARSSSGVGLGLARPGRERRSC